jgi:hypothetical protein
MTKYLSHYHLCLILKEYLLNEKQGKVYASVVFVPLPHSLSAVHFLNRRCTIKELLVWTRDAKWKLRYLKMLCTVKPGILYAKLHKYVILYCWFKSMLSEYNYIHFTVGLTYWIWTAHNLLTIISMTIAHKRTTATYRCTMPCLWRCSTAKVNSAA